jgi:hypothetical protein
MFPTGPLRRSRRRWSRSSACAGTLAHDIFSRLHVVARFYG